MHARSLCVAAAALAALGMGSAAKAQDDGAQALARALRENPCARYQPNCMSPLPQGAGVLTTPRWLESPSPEQIKSAFPPSSSLREAKVDLVCRVAADGALTACELRRQDNLDPAFTQAALDLAKAYKTSPISVLGLPLAGYVVVVPMRFRAD